MSTFHVPLGMGVRENPLTLSPYTISDAFESFPIPPAEGLITEGGALILTEDDNDLTTE